MSEKMSKDGTKELNEQDTEKIAGGSKIRSLGPTRFITPKHPQQGEKKDGGATGGW